MVIAQYYLKGMVMKYDEGYGGGTGLPPLPSQLQVVSAAIRGVNDRLVAIQQDALTTGSALNLYPGLHQCHAVSYNVFLSPDSFS